ncbi:MAG: hypothetical protein ACFFDN_38750 [Candidatus Hodarchaeota archaeon]
MITSNQDILNLLIFSILAILATLFLLIIKNISQHRKIYSFRSKDEVWDHWRPQQFGLILFIIGFTSYIFTLIIYICISHPEFFYSFFGIGINWVIIMQNPLQHTLFVINTSIGFGISIAGMILSIISLGQFIKNIEKKGEGKS